MDCPSASALSDYAEAVLEESVLEEIEGHLDVCDTCRQVVAALTALLAEEARELGEDGPRTDPELPALDATARLELPGGYRELGEHGRGGQGRVLVVEDRILGREVVLKELLRDPALDTNSAPSAQRTANALARFQREARITAQLNHPSIVHVYELGVRANGRPYYTMPLVAGRTLAESLADCQTLAERLEYLPHFADVCQGVAYAHSRGVVHRDLKPTT